MRKSALFAALLVFLWGVAAALAHHPPGTVTIKAAAKKQAAVKFEHAKHMQRVPKCDTCHHTNKGVTMNTDTAIKPCTACHLDVKGKVPSMRDASLQKNPFHMLCIKCHKEQKKGPVICTGCHKK